MSTPPTRTSASPNPQRYALVTGAASGIGLEVFKQLAGFGYRVAVVDRDRDAVDRCCQQHHDATPLPCPVDVADPDAWHDLIEQLRGEWPRLDLLVNNAGVLVGGELHRMSIEDCRQVLDVNLWGTLLGCRAAAPWLIESAADPRPREPGLPLPGIINTASIFASLAPPGFAAYSATKAGVVALSESLRGELAPHGLNVTVSLPGATATRLFDKASYATEEFAEAVETHRLPRELTAQQVALATLRAAAKGRPTVIIGGLAQRFAWLKHLLPGVTRRHIAERACRELGLPSDQEPRQTGE